MSEARGKMSTGLGSASLNTLRSRQIGALRRMLNLNAAPAKSTVAAEPVWKVLIYDEYGSDIISPLLTVKELRSLGVTLHLLIDSPREQISDAVAVYFLMPTRENIAKICQDCRAQLYDSYYFNFTTPISRTLLEDLAKAALEANCVAQISKVFDQYLNFISLEEDFFVIRHRHTEEISYHALSRTDSLDTDIQNICETVVESLFSVFVTTGTIPIIRCPRGNAAEMVAVALDKKLRDNLRDPRSGMFSGDSMPVAQLSFSRPLLVILDRNIDLATPLHHTWTYQALAHDVLEMQLNRVTLPQATEESGASPQEPEKTYDLLVSDRFWQTHRGSPFPEVADAVESEVKDYKASEEEVMRLKSVMGVSDEDDPDMVSGALTDRTAKLSSAISSLPELMERKKSIDMHTNIATALLAQIKERKLDTFYEMEDKMITKSSLDKSVLDILSDPTAGHAEDKMRLFIIYYILSQDMSEADLVQYTSALESSGADTAPIAYLKSWKAYTKMATNPRAQWLGGTGTSTSMSTVFSQLMNTGTKLMNLVVGTKNLPVTRVVDQLMEQKASKDTEDYRYFDPKLLRVTDSSLMPRSRTSFQEAYVFMVGGGNYIEYQNLQDYCRRQQNAKRVTYGTSQLMNAQQFLAQLSELGRGSQ